MSRRTLGVSAGVCVLVLGVVAGLAGTARATSRASRWTGTQTFTDATGDGKGAPDVTTVTVSDDYASGTIQVTLTAVGYSTIDPAQQPDIDVYIDSDRNRATGSSASGSEYDLFAGRDPTGAYWDVGHNDGSSWSSVPQTSTMSFSRTGDTVTWTLNKSDLGGTTGFDFYVAAGVYDANGNITAIDFAPEAGKWTYFLSNAPAVTTTTVAAAPVKPVIDAPYATPAKAVAGKRFSVSFPVSRSDNGEALTGAKATFAVSVLGKAVAHTQSFAAGSAKTSFLVPKGAKGKLLTIKVTVQFGGQSTTRVALYHVG